MVKQSDEEGEECSKNPAECVKTMEQSTSAVGEQLSQTPPRTTLHNYFYYY